METIAITGINGFIGSRVAEELLGNGYKVIGLSIEDKPVIENDNLFYFQVDLTQWKDVQSIILGSRIDALIHLAAIAHVGKGEKIPDEMYRRINYLAAKNIFKCTHLMDIRVFFASTIDVYGACKEHVWSEDINPEPVTMYGKTKYMAERCLQDLYKDKTEKYLIARFAPVYSKDRMTDVHKRIYINYPKLAFKLGTNPTYTFLALENVVKFIFFWISKGNQGYNIVNICDEKGVTAEDLIEREKAAGRARYVIRIPKTFSKTIAMLAERLLYSESKRELGFTLTKVFCPRALNTRRLLTMLEA